jgi:hypothetical protein
MVSHLPMLEILPVPTVSLCRRDKRHTQIALVFRIDLAGSSLGMPRA